MKINIAEYDYNLPEERVAKFPVERRDDSKLLVYRGGEISEDKFLNIGNILERGSLLVFNNTRVVRARIVMRKPGGARIEIFCLEPIDPADYERAFAACGTTLWSCMVGNSKRWKDGTVAADFLLDGKICRLEARREGKNIRFEWSGGLTFGELLERLGSVPIPPYLDRESEAIDTVRYQTVYAKIEGSVAAPTAGLHFTDELIERLKKEGFGREEITLHVGAGTFLPVKGDNAAEHTMHPERFSVRLSTIEQLRAKLGHIVAVGTTSVRTLESLIVLGYRITTADSPQTEKIISQWEIYDVPNDFSAREALELLCDYMKANKFDCIGASTRIMITPCYKNRMINALITNFHQPRSTLLLLVSSFVGDNWRRIYEYALSHDFRFLSYGDSSIIIP